MGLKNKKHGKLLLQISFITGSVMIISVLLTMLMIQQISMNIYFSAKAEMMKADIMTFAEHAVVTDQMDWFVGYLNEQNRATGQAQNFNDYLQNNFNINDNLDLLKKYYNTDDLDPTVLTSEEQRNLACIVYWLLVADFYALTNTSYDRMNYMNITDEHTAFIIASFLNETQDKTNEESTYIIDQLDMYNVRIEYESSEHSAVDDILSGALNEKGAVIFEQYYDNEARKDYYNAYTTVFADGEPLFVLSLQYDWTDFRASLISNFTIWFIISVAVTVVINGLLMIFIYNRAISPVLKVNKGVQNYMNEKNSTLTADEMSRIKVGNEVGMLAESFSYMASEIDRYIGEVRTVTAEKERIDTELNMAAHIQMSQLPREFPAFPDHKEFDLYASMDPAKEVGGDFYDFFLIDDDRLALVIADVSGKGVPAALFMMASKMLVESYSRLGGTPAEILVRVNDHMCEQNPESMFVTMWLGILEISTGKMTCCNAGHEYPAIKKDNGKFALLNDKHGLFIGEVSGIKYKDYEIQLEKGDTLFVYTDGVPEATNAAEELFGTERMIDALNDDRSEDLEGLLHTVRRHVDEFVGDAPQFDDLTMLAFRYLGNDSQEL